MSDLKWKDAIAKVLEEEKKALHYTEIAGLIAERGYRKSLGFTPNATVSSNLTTDIKANKGASIFVRIGEGVYILRKYFDDNLLLLPEVETGVEIGEKSSKQRISLDDNKIINAFGIYWNRNSVHWKTTPDLFGFQLIGSSEINFKDQIGIYLLHDNREIIYVGQALDQPLGQRLKYHTTDRLSGRWDRFSWFGFYPISESGILNIRKKFENISLQKLGDTLEAILIESIEPRQNRKQGNLFFGLEYLQKESPELRKNKLIKELTENLR